MCFTSSERPEPQAGAPGEANTVLERITDAFVAVDRDWRFTYINDRALQHVHVRTGRPLTREELLGTSFWDLNPDAVGSEFDARYHEAMREQLPAEFESRYAPTGQWFEVHAYPSADGLSIFYRDITAMKRAQEEADVRASQQAAVAELGLRALVADDIQALMDEAVAIVAGTLSVEMVAIAEILPGSESLLLRAGVGWRPGAVGHGTGPAGRKSLVGYTIQAGAPVISHDVMADERFDISPLLGSYGAVSAVSVVIGGRGEPFGALGAFATDRRAFSDDDVNFMQAVANVVATAVEAEQAQARLLEVREAERRRIARDLHDEALQDLTRALAIAGVAGAPAARAGLVPALRRVGEQLRAAIYDLRLGDEEERPFVDLLETLVEVHRGMALDGPRLELTVHEGVPDRPLGAVGIEVLRILGEALTNARRHSDAQRVTVEVWASAGSLRVEVSDDGHGTDSATPDARRGSGIQSMRERAAQIEAELEISSTPGDGMRVLVEVPLGGGADERSGLVRVLLVEDHIAVRQAIASAFEREAGFEVVGQAASLAEARKMLQGVDVAVVDLGLPDGYGADLIAELGAANPRAEAIVLSASLDRADIARAVEAGAAGVLNKAAHFDDVVRAVRRVRAGETLMGIDEIVELLQFAGRRREREERDRRVIQQLTPREREVLQALADGLDTQAIARRLHISVRTARNHMSNILAKLGVHSQLQALVLALRYDVVEIRR